MQRSTDSQKWQRFSQVNDNNRKITLMADYGGLRTRVGAEVPEPIRNIYGQAAVGTFDGRLAEQMPTQAQESDLPYTVGALLYSPAINPKIASFVTEHRVSDPYSLVLCLEDSIGDDIVEEAEKQVVRTFRSLSEHCKRHPEDPLPKLFIRVRNARQVTGLYDQLKELPMPLTGFIFPKYSLTCAEAYNEAIDQVNRDAEHKIYMMPVLEDRSLIPLHTRYLMLDKLKELVDEMRPYVLNVRVGGNDFCKEFGIRRRYDETIYDIQAVAHILGDIVTSFAQDYVVSGPVWEYFAGEEHRWRDGLIREMQQDRLNGFVGKTVIHPNQIPVVNSFLQVSRDEYEDAISILHWHDAKLQVGKNSSGERMNEVRTHLRWAEKTAALGRLYGVKENESS